MEPGVLKTMFAHSNPSRTRAISGGVSWGGGGGGAGKGGGPGTDGVGTGGTGPGGGADVRTKKSDAMKMMKTPTTTSALTGGFLTLQTHREQASQDRQPKSPTYNQQ